MIRGIEVPKVGICTVRKALAIRNMWILAMEDYESMGEFAKANYLHLFVSVLDKHIGEFVRRNRRLSPSERTCLLRCGFIKDPKVGLFIPGWNRFRPE